ncbi:MAG: hypothetical protein HYY04_13705 [Chloroflexi bacterium]|nr:hypothetical protein [Chloroflexota bacterium]
MAIQPVAAGQVQALYGTASSPRGGSEAEIASQVAQVQTRLRDKVLDDGADRVRTVLAGVNSTPTYNVQARIEPSRERGGAVGTLINRTA